MRFRLRIASSLRLLKNGSSAAALAAAISLAATTGAHAQAARTASETVTVTGFKASLERAWTTSATPSARRIPILAEDIAKFPDINLSESIQRIPGVRLSRDQGEGREIAVRGLSPLFTRVRINGMEAIATTGAEDVNGGTNRGRAFDFNVFASDLFSGITVHKTSSADTGGRLAGRHRRSGDRPSLRPFRLCHRRLRPGRLQ